MMCFHVCAAPPDQESKGQNSGGRVRIRVGKLFFCATISTIAPSSLDSLKTADQVLQRNLTVDSLMSAALD